MKILFTFTFLVFTCCCTCFAQQQASNFNQTSQAVQAKLQKSVDELNALRQQVADEMIPFNRNLSELENTLDELRNEHQKVIRTLDSRNLDITNLTSEINKYKEQSSYLSNLFTSYIKDFQGARLHISEMQIYRDLLEKARLATENGSLAEKDVFEVQTEVILAAIDRLEEALNGKSFTGSAIDSKGTVKTGLFTMVGPSAVFRSDDGQAIGTAQLRMGSLEPVVIEFGNVMDTEQAELLVNSGKGMFPLDPTGGNAHVVEQTNQTLIEHIQKGGPVMYPILGMAGLALLVALCKWIYLCFMPKPSAKSVSNLLTAVATEDDDMIQAAAAKIAGPAGKMINVAVEHINEPIELIEEVMFETVLSAKYRLQSWLPFISICASSAPLLGLLGTVTGIINTFKLITVFGSSDVKTLSGGISEALITTEFGLIVAIPSLLLYAFLSRKAKSVVDTMEQTAVALVNQLSKTRAHSAEKIKVG